MSANPRKTRLAAYVICVDDGKVLLSRWVSPKGPVWMLPGGGVDFGEHPMDGAIREVEEETGYIAEIDTLLGIDTIVRPDFHGVRVIYEGRVVGGELRFEVGGSSDMAAWFDLDEVADLVHAEMLDTALALLRTRPATGRLAS
ncbi:ADP-ribose pyrophosphatase YjhB, NUDIX family [Actinokineospora alba]|uniref:ADP-ribose pyrophosphatase YjhB, NUDIX family n=1 Tax=Actinokineospora alba TaxID=504798 RepID=A0A1H0VS16_9PSEU|nr:NUDIX hydrolase [Actinokineospora alba]TDP70146.1 ADP-ribose pyrophosphatase YjhB (NUDIX family) [Actinokineospora alba]SDI37961.1 ADP-ribose pyrophosphatase YjhB, NUDIX family [Actinokineospora alba]SDP80998.1 ADP-ribose pyrophosphatase YjhB, NUDIX family [Actinokineospora alba]